MKVKYFLSISLLLLIGAAAASAQKEASDCTLPKDPAIATLVKQALLQEDKNDLAGAIETDKKILAIDAKNECAMTAAAGLYGKLGEFEQEVIWAKKAVEANPKFINAYINLGNGYALQGKLKEAAESYNKAAAIEPNNPLPIYSLGVLAEQQDKFQEALSLYQRSVRLDPKFEDGYFNLAAMYANLKRFDEAKAALKKLLEINPAAEDAKAMLRRIESIKP